MLNCKVLVEQQSQAGIVKQAASRWNAILINKSPQPSEVKLINDKAVSKHSEQTLGILNLAVILTSISESVTTLQGTFMHGSGSCMVYNGGSVWTLEKAYERKERPE